MNLYPGIAFFFRNEKKIRKCVILEIHEGIVYYYYFSKFENVVDNITVDSFYEKCLFDTSYYENNDLNAKIIGYKESSMKYGMTERKKAFLYSIMRIDTFDFIDDERIVFILSSIADRGTRVKMVPEEIKILFPINSYNYKINEK